MGGISSVDKGVHALQHTDRMVPDSIAHGSWERRLTYQNLTTGAKIARLLKTLDSARRNASLYPDNHPRLAGSLEELGKLIETLCEKAPSIKLTIYRQECFLNGESSEEELAIPVGFSDRFLRLGLASVIFPHNTDIHDLLGFLRFLGSDPRDTAEAPDINARARSYRLGKIELEGLDYGRLFAEDIGLPAEVDERDEEQFARLLTLWDPHGDHREMGDEDIKALTRLAEDQTALKRLMELSLRGSEKYGDSPTPVVGTVAVLEGLAMRLRALLPERWDRMSQTLVGAALALDSELLRRKRPDLLQQRLFGRDGRGWCHAVVQEMDEDKLAAVIAEALAGKEELDPMLSVVIRDLVPEREHQVALGPLIAGELRVLGLPASRRREIRTWWEESVIEAPGERDETDTLVASSMLEFSGAAVSTEVEQSSLGAWFRTDYGDAVLLSYYFEDLRSLLGLEIQPEDVQLVLGSYQTEFQALADSGNLDVLRETIDELSGELTRCGRPAAETMRPVLSVGLVDALSDQAVFGDSAQRSHVMAIARAFGPSGFRVIMTAISKTDDWEILEELRGEIQSYGSDVVDELLNWLSHSDIRVAKEAVLLVRKVGDERVVSKIEPLLYHSDAEYRAAALATLAKIAGSRRYNALEKGLADRSAVVVDVALDAVAEFGPESFVGPLRRLLLRDRQDTDFHHVRAKAIRLIGNRGLSQLVGELEDIVKGAESWIRFTRDGPLVPYVVRALLQLDDARGRAFVKKRSRWWRARRVREACKQALREVSGDD